MSPLYNLLCVLLKTLAFAWCTNQNWYKLICQILVHFLSFQIVVWAAFIKLLGMYNFDIDLKKTNEKTSWKCRWCRSRWIATFVSTWLWNFQKSLINFWPSTQITVYGHTKAKYKYLGCGLIFVVIQMNIYHTRAIITRCLYIFHPFLSKTFF